MADVELFQWVAYKLWNVWQYIKSLFLSITLEVGENTELFMFLQLEKLKFVPILMMQHHLKKNICFCTSHLSAFEAKSIMFSSLLLTATLRVAIYMNN